MVYRHIVPPGEQPPFPKPTKQLAPRGKAAKKFAAGKGLALTEDGSPVLTSSGALSKEARKLLWKDQQQGFERASKSLMTQEALVAAAAALKAKDEPEEGISEARTREIIEAILCAVSEGHPLKTTCRALGMPYHLVWARIDKDRELRDRFEAARRTGLWARADMVIEVSERNPARAKVLSDMVQWQSKHLLPDVFGPPKQTQPTTLIQIGIRGGNGQGDQAVQVLAVGATETNSLIPLGRQTDSESAEALSEALDGPLSAPIDPDGP